MSRLKDMTLDELSAALKVASGSRKIGRFKILHRQFERKRSIPILASHDIYLIPDIDAPDAFNNERFASLFRVTWRRIPKPARDMMLDSWKTLRKDPSRPSYLVPHISLCLKWHGWTGFPDLREAVFGSVITPTQSILFYGPIIDQTPEQHVMEVIAHELAHVYLGIEFLRGYGQFTEGREAKLEEKVTNACAKKWGFDMPSLYKWFRSDECEDLCMGVIRQYKLERKPEDFAKDNTDGSKAVDVPAS